ncbi:respiratory nitrate reductase subunit gamma [Bacillus sp. FJAT-27251]|uniref:respiratory nitrate reductase subunit gamma n=1 Tax=Bacillus sp. FJAT-27251 TaxID=1684142 RepID=UPI0006A7AD65|nr:respiratory nitrate reductase subunit gamma [Bacillus sp. FJAT-27251]
MEIEKLLLWIVFPYMVVAIFGMGVIWQFDTPAGTSASSIPERILTRSLKCLLILCTITGVGLIHFTDEFTRLLLWLLSLLQLRPDLSLILNASLLSKMHFIIVFVFLLALAFTNKMAYIIKPHLYIKRLHIYIKRLHIKLRLVRRHL